MHSTLSTWFLASAVVALALELRPPSALEAGAPRAERQDARARTTPVEVRLHGLSAELQPDIEDLVGRAAARAEELLGRQRRRADELVIHLYAAEADYLEASRRLSDGRFDANLAFAHMDTKSAHVMLQPPMGPELLEVVGLPYMTRFLLAHETTHLVRYSALPNHASNPAWFADGLGQLVASDVTRGRRSHLEIPGDATAWARAAALAREDRLPSVEAILRGEDAQLPAYDRYRVRRCFVEFLRSELGERALREVCAELARLGGGRDTVEPMLKLLARHRDYQERFERWISAAAPQWEEELRSLWWSEDDLIQVAWPDDSAHTGRMEPLPTEPFEVRGRATILPATRTQLNLRFEREGGGFYQVAFVADQGVVFFLNHPAEGWSELGRFASEALPLGEPFDFVVTHADGSASVTIGGEQLGELRWPKGRIAGRLALSAQAGAAGIWHSIDVGAATLETDER